MSSENQNNPDWKNKLDDENDLSAEILLNKNIAWEKLHDRLQQKPGRKKVLWYWVAAACLVPAILISLTLLFKNENPAVKNNVVKSELPKAELKQIQRLESRPFAEVFTANVTKQKTRKIETKSDRHTAIAIANKEHFEANIQSSDNEIKPDLPVADSFYKATIAVAQPKKKLKVVHINELGEPAEESPVTVQHSNLHYFQLKLANQEVYMNKSLTSHNSGVNLFELKSPTSN